MGSLLGTLVVQFPQVSLLIFAQSDFEGAGFINTVVLFVSLWGFFKLSDGAVPVLRAFFGVLVAELLDSD